MSPKMEVLQRKKKNITNNIIEMDEGVYHNLSKSVPEALLGWILWRKLDMT